DRQTARIDNIGPVDQLRDIKKVAVIGSGTMGGGIAMNFANRKIPVRIVDVSDEAIQRGMAVVRSNYERSVKKGKMTPEKLESVMALFQPTLGYEDLSDCDLIIEAVFENMALKKEIFEKLDGVAKPGAILATNTSTLDVDEIASATGRPEDVLGLHFFSPANIMRLLEVVRGKQTSDQVLATCMKLGKTIGKVAVVSGVCYGFIGNRMLEGYGREAGFLHLEGASVGQIDKAIFDFGFPMGPLTMSDLAGNDVGAKVRAECRQQGMLPDDPRYGVIGDKLTELNRFGQKTGAGFYRYEKGSRAPIPDSQVEALAEQEAARLNIERRDITDEEIVNRCLLPMINEGAMILEEGIAQRASDIDVVWVNGYGFPPYRGGPMFYADQIGLDKVHAQIVEYGERFGNEHGYWTPSNLLVDLAKSGRKFGDV
ncbi:MAG: 3-hydroxyacyl-CoA dehydrogenase NAD-binding domain-containing protein, partial [Pseudomonadota bacterium]